MKVIDNFEYLSKLLSFNNSNEFYFLQIIQRKKDGNITQVGNNGYRTIKTYYIFSKEQLEHYKPKIIELCENNNARAYLNMNIRNAQEVALSCISEYAKLVSENNAYQGYRVWDSCCGKTKSSKYPALWVIDLDSKKADYIMKVLSIISSCRSSYNEEDRIVGIVPTLHGVHVLSHKFDIMQFQQLLNMNNLDTVDIQKDNPTLLYFKSLE